MTKEDYMKLTKERLAELLAERDSYVPPFFHGNIMPCEMPGGVCTNPHHDCINCHRPHGDIGTITTTNTFGEINNSSQVYDATKYSEQ